MSVLKYKDPTSGEWMPVSYGAGSEGVEMELLWENASPTSAFAAQTIALDLSEYQQIEIHSSLNTTASGNSAGYYSTRCDVGTNAWYIMFGGYECIELRNAFVRATGVEFSAGGRVASYGNSNLQQPGNRMIPQKIYGIKGVVK